VNDSGEHWQFNYFNYFTEVEEHFQKARGTGLFLLSPLDWALVESWKNAGIPLEAVLRGIDAAFEKWRSRRSKFRLINSLTYCAQAVMEEAEAMAGVAMAKPARETAAPFSLDEVRRYLEAGAHRLHDHPQNAYAAVAEALERILAGLEAHYGDLEELEQRLTALEEKMAAIARAAQSEEVLFQARRELDLQLRPYRSKMTAAQLALLEKQYLDRKLLEAAGLPRLSLFYLR
jgi:hypothetical protein